MCTTRVGAASSQEPPMTSDKSGAAASTRAPTKAPAEGYTAATSPAPSAVQAVPRQPRQERGERRVCAILDAAAALITECGAEGLTVQALAERALTSKG